LRQVERKEKELMYSPFVTVRYPDGAWELTESDALPKVGDTLRRSDGRWVVATAARDTSGHLIVTWQRAAPRTASSSDSPIAEVRP
jgi:hypothetical protein